MGLFFFFSFYFFAILGRNVFAFGFFSFFSSPFLPEALSSVIAHLLNALKNRL